MKKFFSIVLGLSTALLCALIAISCSKAAAPVAPQKHTSFVGVGIILSPSTENGDLKIQGFAPDSPALKAGIQPGSILTSIDGVETTGKTLKECVDLIRGEPDTQVTLTVIDPTHETKTFALTRSTISVPVSNPRKP